MMMTRINGDTYTITSIWYSFAHQRYCYTYDDDRETTEYQQQHGQYRFLTIGQGRDLGYASTPPMPYKVMVWDAGDQRWTTWIGTHDYATADQIARSRIESHGERATVLRYSPELVAYVTA
jgi:hypothetical protein